MATTRRDFLALCGAGLSLAAMGFADPDGDHPAPCLLLEARSFASLGGWLLDPQFADIMGSPFLLAHGLGIPVADATTTAVVLGIVLILATDAIFTVITTIVGI